ncbi:hypothetical protein J2Y58_000901 [Sphingomonas sp. BE138]|nr:hypothetical protein [Sphingomonas sp. BE138]
MSEDRSSDETGSEPAVHDRAERALHGERSLLAPVLQDLWLGMGVYGRDLTPCWHH